MKKKCRHLCAGFTLIELIIVLGVIAVVGSTTLATYRGIQRRTLNNASLTLQADFRRAQRMAIIEGRRWRVSFNQHENHYSVYSMPRNLAEHVHTVYLPSGVWISYFNAAYVEYLPRGTIHRGFTLRLRKGNYEIRMTGAVSGGRIAVDAITRL